MSSTMRTVLTAVVLATAGVESAAQAGEPEWIRQFGTGGSDIASDVATGPGGRVTVVGYHIDRTYLKQHRMSAAFDRDGTELSLGFWGGFGDESVNADCAGILYVVGATDGPLGGTHKGGKDGFLIKFDRDGRILWRRQPGTHTYDRASRGATGVDGNVYVVGVTQGWLGGTYQGGGDAFVAAYDRDGRTLWRDQPGTSNYDTAFGVATDADGSVYIAGSTSGSLPGNANLGSDDAFLIKYGPGGSR